MLLLLDLALEEVDAPEELLLRLDWLAIAEPKRMHLDLLKLQIALAAVVRAHEGHLVCKLCCIGIKQVGWTEQALQEPVLLAVSAYFTSFALGTLIAGEVIADSALAGSNGKLLADSTDQKV